MTSSSLRAPEAGADLEVSEWIIRRDLRGSDLGQSRAVNGSSALGTRVVVTLCLVSHLQQHPQPARDVAPPHALPRDGEVLQLA